MTCTIVRSSATTTSEILILNFEKRSLKVEEEMNVLRFFEIIVSTSKSINVRQIVRESIDSCNVTNISFGVDIKNRFSRGIHLSQRKVKSGGIRSSWRLHISNFRDINTNERQDPRSRTGNTSCVGGTLVHRSCR